MRVWPYMHRFSESDIEYLYRMSTEERVFWTVITVAFGLVVVFLINKYFQD